MATATVDYETVFNRSKRLVTSSGKVPTPLELQKRLKTKIDMKVARKLFVDLKQWFKKQQARLKSQVEVVEKPHTKQKVSTSFGIGL